MKLLPEEREWLEAFSDRIRRSFPGRVRRVVVFGSKARGESTPDSDLDVLVVVGEADWASKSRIRFLGYELALGKDVVPSILVYSADEFRQRKESRSIFLESIEQTGVAVP